MKDTQQILNELHSIRRRGYGYKLPGEHDAKFVELAEQYAAWDEAARVAIRESVPDDCRLLLLGFGDRLAVVADRTANERLVFLSLIANSIEDFRHDERENVFRLALAHHVADKLGAPTSEMLEEAAALSSPRGAAALRAFINRPAELKSLQAMGIVEEETDEGVDYRYE